MISSLEGYAYFEEAYCWKTRDAPVDSWKGRGPRRCDLVYRATSVYRARVSETFRLLWRAICAQSNQNSWRMTMVNSFIWIFVGSKNRREKYRAKVENISRKRQRSIFNRHARIADKFRRVFLRTSWLSLCESFTRLRVFSSNGNYRIYECHKYDIFMVYLRCSSVIVRTQIFRECRKKCRVNEST